MGFDYFYGQQSEQFSFYRVPKVLFSNDKFWNISTDAKLLYGILLDRMNLSAKNQWIDEEMRVFIIFTIDEVKAAIGCAEKKAVKLLDELENKCGLIERKRQGLGKPNIIYVKNFLENDVQNPVERQFLNCQKHNSGVVKNTIQEQSKAQCNNTELNNTDISDINPSFFPEDPERTIEEIGSENSYEQYLKEKLEYESLVFHYNHHVQMLDEIFEIIADTLSSNKKTIRIGGDDKPAELVKNKFMKLEYDHIQFVMEGILANTTKVRNIRQYLLTTLYNATQTIDSYYTTLVQHDLNSY